MQMFLANGTCDDAVSKTPHFHDEHRDDDDPCLEHEVDGFA
jgi:hypothetical protein